jgi:hypothetical protein
VQSTASTNPDAQAIIAADNDVKHGYVVKVINIVRTNVLSRFAINVRKPPTAPRLERHCALTFRSREVRHVRA